MIKRVLILLMGITAFWVSGTFAEDLDVELSCPTSVYAGSVLRVTAYVSNDGDSAVTLNRYAAGMVGTNTNNVLSSSRVFGPYARTMNPRTIPATGQTVKISSLSIVNSVSADFKGKMAMVVVDFVNARGNSLGGGTCLVNVP
ncbi:hypothetical protein [Syntrophus sp. (in: bacteria)]|uniref:hypothetical protein n=1 Tax=Syntrophus sp. (in: bacteria) TaxID=48412 RepID=UPI00345EAFB2